VPFLLATLLRVLASVQAADTVAIPASSTTLGSASQPDSPPRSAQVAAFRIDRAEVSVADFEAFARQAWERADWWSPEGWAWAGAHPQGAGAAQRAAGRRADHPVVAVTWFEADAYCRSQGGRLPSEEEWELAACGGRPTRFPWGDAEPSGVAWYDEGKTGHVAQVDTLAVREAVPGTEGPFGLLHASGNVWEWTSGAYGRPGPDGRPRWRTLRGGSYTNLPSYCTCTHREPASPERVAFTTGFRCAYPSP
jgi:iron(II)-dependent oxidoreductase